MSNLRQRVISALVLAVIVLTLTWLGGIWFRFVAAVIGVAVMHEWLSMHRDRLNPAVRATAWAAIAAVAAAILADLPAAWAGLLIAGAGFALLSLGILRGQGGLGALGFVYAAAPALVLAKLRGADPSGLTAMLFLFAVVWGTDIAAYFCGRALGGPKLAPSISPGKTISGAIGGAAGGVAAGVGVMAMTGAMAGAAAWTVPLLALAMSVVSQAGDLFESAIKRKAGVKDSSNLIPGHGGVMDRVDALVIAAILLYLFCVVTGGADSPASGVFPAFGWR
ncbi:MAG: phosphatidate cytidylyltransferase [Phyllobacteriaceae bacterium]|nr:phosphatidate cytidylyltransferase [Phyllobacteriaceae bacterium]